jgi:hypothetical protein
MAEVIIFERDNERSILLSRAIRGIKHQIGFDKICQSEEETIKAIFEDHPKIVIISKYLDDEISSDIYVACIRMCAVVIIIENKNTYKPDCLKIYLGNIVDRENDLSKFKIKFEAVYAKIKIELSKTKVVSIITDNQIFVDKINGFKVWTNEGFKYRKPRDLLYSKQQRNGSEAHFFDKKIYHTPLSNTTIFDLFSLKGVIKISPSIIIQILHISVDDIFNLKSILMEGGKILKPTQPFIDHCILRKITEWNDLLN